MKEKNALATIEVFKLIDGAEPLMDSGGVFREHTLTFNFYNGRVFARVFDKDGILVVPAKSYYSFWEAVRESKGVVECTLVK